MQPSKVPDLAALELACQRLAAATPSDAAHDLAHFQRVVACARRLAQPEGARLEIVVPAAWLHDCVPVPKDSPQRTQGSRLSAARASEWLAEQGWPGEWIPDVAHAIEAHSFSAGIPPRTPEARVVQDADRLDALGANGLARTLMLAGAWGSALYQPADPFCERRAPDDRRYAVDHLFAKLLKLESTMQTAAGRAEAGRRTQFLRSFLAQLGEELPGRGPA